jgi:rhodanese-related sulfurtransferase
MGFVRGTALFLSFKDRNQSRRHFVTYKNVILSALIMGALLIMTDASVANPEKFPYRGDFQGVKTVETEDLKAKLDSDEFVVVDARTQLEFDVIHIDGAQHISLSKTTFKEEVLALASANPGKKIAFYCNGTTCQKAYKAAQKAMIAGIEESYAYDAGIPEWARDYPEDTKLLGETIIDPEAQLISKESFNKHVLEWSEFKAFNAQENVMVIDVRDVMQRGEKMSDLDNVRPVPLDIFIPNFVSKKFEQDKTLLIFDQVGKQVKWLQYYLQEYGYESYYFLEGGATTVLKSQQYRS